MTGFWGLTEIRPRWYNGDESDRSDRLHRTHLQVSAGEQSPP